MSEIFYQNEVLIVIGAFISIFLWMEFEKQKRVYPNLKGLDEGNNYIINFLDLLLTIGVFIIEFSTFKWWVAIIHLIVFWFLAPFISGLIAVFFKDRLLFFLALGLKLLFIFIIYYRLIF